MKTCCRCGEPRPLDDFYSEKRNKDGKAGACKTCYKAGTAASQRAWFSKMGPEAAKAYNRKRWLWSKYRITPEQYMELLERYEGRCAICRQPESREGYMLAVDHDHETGRNRGLLCGQCNTGLGKFRDDPFLLRNAMEYLTTADFGVPLLQQPSSKTQPHARMNP